MRAFSLSLPPPQRYRSLVLCSALVIVFVLTINYQKRQLVKQLSEKLAHVPPGVSLSDVYLKENRPPTPSHHSDSLTLSSSAVDYTLQALVDSIYRQTVFPGKHFSRKLVCNLS